MRKLLYSILLMALPQAGWAEVVSDTDGLVIEFDFEGHAEERDRIRGYFIKDFKEEKEMIEALGDRYEPPSIGISKVDLNDDGKAEILAYLSSRFMCGASRCPVYFFSDGEQLKEIQSIHKNSELVIYHHSTNGYRDIGFKESFSTAEESRYNRWIWDGENYTLWQDRE